ncbi:hypothetical protein CsSME_00000393 [Camellia sinensis var. sinensis]
MREEAPLYRKIKVKLLEEAKGLKPSLHTRVWRMTSVLSSWHSWQENISKKVMESSRPADHFIVVGRPPQVVSQNKNWSARGRRSLHTESKVVVWWPTRKGDPKIKKISYLTRKLTGRKESGLQGKKLVSHLCTTFQTRKTKFVPKTNQKGCKTRDREAKRAAGSLENWSTGIKSGLRPQKWSPDHSVPLGRGNKVWFKNQAKRRTLSGPETRRAAEGSENRKLVSKRKKWSTTTEG